MIIRILMIIAVASLLSFVGRYFKLLFSRTNKSDGNIYAEPEYKVSDVLDEEDK